MTATTYDQATAHRASSTPARVGFGRTLAIEFRKLVDTRAALWLLIATFALALAAIAIMTGVSTTMGSAELSVSASSLVTAGIGAPAMLTPVLAILLATGEWTRRGAMVTFVLEPRRMRVLAAKLIAVVAVSTIASAIGGLVGLAATFGLNTFGGQHLATALDWKMIGWNMAVAVLSGVQGFAFGSLLMNTPAAIVAYYVLPSLLQIGEMLGEGFRTVLSWINMGGAYLPLTVGSGDVQWGKVAVSTAVWVLLPLIAGSIRLVRREVN